MKTLVEVIEHHFPSAADVHFTGLLREEQIDSKSYQEIVLEAKLIASCLVETLEPQSRVLLLFPSSLEFISGFLGCLYAGMIAVPAYPLQNPKHAYRLKTIIDSCSPGMVLGSPRAIEDLNKAEGFQHLRTNTAETLIGDKRDAQDLNVKITEEMIAFLQYTSGSTGNPKGIMVSHQNLLHNLSTAKEGWGLGENKTSVLWLPFQHDLGLIGGVLSSLYNRNNFVFLTPISVIQQPYRWLKAISDYKAYYTAGPNFAYQLCASKISGEELATLDLSSLGYALVAAEPNHLETMNLFCEKFAPCGFRPESYCVGYGLAENTLHVTTNTPGERSPYIELSKTHLESGQVTDPEGKEDRRNLMSAGTLHPEHHVAIVNPKTSERRPPDEVGEIWVNSRSAGQGYWRNEEATKETFQAQIKGEDAFNMRTGDLGFIRDDHLYVTGRLKDLMIIDGRNIYPQDVEALVESSHQWIKPGSAAAFSITAGSSEAIVVAVEIRRDAMKKDLSELKPIIRRTVAENFEVSIHSIRFLMPNGAFKTTSGKIQRNATKQAYLKNELKEIPEATDQPKSTSEELTADLKNILCDVLDLKNIGPDQRFTELGGTSIHATLLQQKFEEYFGGRITVSPTIAFDYPTLAELIEWAEKAVEQPQESVENAAQQPHNEPIAIVGIGCRFPGKVRNIRDLWDLLIEGADAIEEIPSWRWDVSKYDKEIRDRITQAGVIDDIEQFDAPLFNISPKEARQMDPQQRILLEVVWEALENAAMDPHSLKKGKTGVFIGSSGRDYKNLIAKYDNDANIDPYFVLDTASSVIAGRIAYFLGTRGPAETIDTACSSSLVAIDAACQAIQAGKIKMAIAGGVNALLYPENSVGLTRANMLSPTKRCRTFSKDADGYVRGEGCGVVILKPLSEAIKDRDRIHAIIRSSAVNQDGASAGITVPSLGAQKQLLEDALTQANLSPNDVAYIEAHGSATELGDPIEFGAINEVFSGKKRPRPLYVGSIKSNVGHLEGAAGVAGLLKAIASLRNQELPPSIHLSGINPKLDLEATPIEIVQSPTKWHAFDAPRIAGVSSFGFSGTNAHLIVQEAPEEPSRDLSVTLPDTHLFVLSAKTESSLKRLVQSYITYLQRTDDRVEDICFTAAVGRSHLEHRLALSIKDRKDLLAQLQEEKPQTPEDGTAQEYLAGKEIDWEAYYEPYRMALLKVSLPTYSFDHERYWIETGKRKSLSYGGEIHELIGTRAPGFGQRVRFVNQLDQSEVTYLQDHRVFSDVIFPGAAFVESALAATAALIGDSPIELQEFNLLTPLKLTDRVEHQISLEAEEGSYKGEIHSLAEGTTDWKQHISFQAQAVTREAFDFADLPALKTKLPALEIDRLYSDFLKIGLDYGPAFQTIEAGWGDDQEVLVSIKQAALEQQEYCLHPTLLDGVFQATALFLGDGNESSYIPTSITRIRWYQKVRGPLWAHIKLQELTPQTLTADMLLYDDHGSLIAEIQSFTARSINKPAFQKLLQSSSPTSYVEQYELFELPEIPEEAPAKIFIFGRQDACDTLSTEAIEYVRGDDLRGKNLLFVYDDNFKELVAFAKQVAVEEVLSVTLLIQHGMSVGESDPINPDHRKALGFWRCFRKELRGSNCFCIDTDELEKAHRIISLINQKALSEPQIVLRDQAYLPRLVTLDDALASQQKLPTPAQDAYLTCHGSIDTLHWDQRPAAELEEGAVRIRIEATALNFRDVMSAMGLYPGDAGDLGYECSGVVLEVGANVDTLQPEDRVIVMGEGLFGRETVVHQSQVVKIPDTLSFAEGASIPIVFVTANEALNSLAKLKKGQKVLIHAATGGVGLAAMQFAKLKGAEIFATTSAPKQDFLKKQGIKHIYDSRSIDFGEQILKDTSGKGVDVVLNSLTSEGFIASSLSCLSKGGTFVEIGRLNIYLPEEMKAARNDVKYHVIELDTRLKEERETVQAELTEICRLFDQKKLQPLPLSVYSVTDAMGAFHEIEQAKHIGKVVLTTAAPFAYSREGTYLITGGTGGLGRALATHLIERGVRHIALTSRSAASDDLKAWIKEQNIELSHYRADVADREALSKIIDAIQASGAPLKGVFHAAGVLKDGLLSSLSDDDFNEVMSPKVLGCNNLAELSQELDLECFVLFSSVTSLLGNPGQSNYGAANAYMDGLAIQRRQQGLPALSINWGPFANVGMAAGLEAQHRAQGIVPLETSNAFSELENLLVQDLAEIGIIESHWKHPNTLHDPYLSRLARSVDETKGKWIAILESAPLEKRKEILTSKLKDLIGSALGINDPHSINTQAGFFELGMDSIIAVEVKNRIQAKIGTSLRLTNTVAFDYASIQAMRDYLLEELSLVEAAPRKTTSAVVRKQEDIAIVGMSCAFPGAEDTDAFWELLVNGKEGISEVPADRWSNNDYYDPNPEAPGKIVTRRGGFIDDIDLFDSKFFNISPREATFLDPQQRLLLKHTYLAFENADIPISSARGEDVGVFIGISTNDYSRLIQNNSGAEGVNAYLGSGNTSSTAGGRISYTFGFQGPNLAIDTACSSSLVALNEACDHLELGDCTSAVVGGVSVLLNPNISVSFSKAGMLAPDGKCKTFDALADGYVRGEGCGIVILKPLSDALRDGNTILALIKGSGVNQDGAVSGLTVPNGQAQERLMQKVLEKAHLRAEEIEYIECHGTGTSLGDPIEIHAVGNVYGRERKEPLYLGSAKTNIGHLEAGSGIAGLIKAVLALNHKIIPKHLNFHNLNPNINLDFRAEIVTETRDWTRSKHPRRAAVNSFGFSGTNAHLILEEPPELTPRDSSLTLPDRHLFVLSAKSKNSLEKLVQSYTTYLASTKDRIEDICYTSSTGRMHLDHRLALFTTDREDLLQQLQASDLKRIKIRLGEETVQSKDLDTLSEGYLEGKIVDWEAYYEPYRTALQNVTLPAYCFDQKRYWIDIKKTKRLPYGEQIHELAGVKLPGFGQRIRFVNQLNVSDVAYLKDHRVFDEIIFPGAAFLESALAATATLIADSPIELREFNLLAPLKLTDRVEYQVSLEAVEDSYKGDVHSLAQGATEWKQHIGFQAQAARREAFEFADLPALQEKLPALKIDTLYADFLKVGLDYGPAFQTIEAAWGNEKEVLVSLKQEPMEQEGYCLHPTLLDGVFQATALLVGDDNKRSYIPASIKQMRWYQKVSGPLWVHIKLQEVTPQALTADMRLYDGHGSLIAEIQGFTARAIEKSAFQKLLRSSAAGLYAEHYELFELPDQIKEARSKILTFGRWDACETLSTEAIEYVQSEELTGNNLLFVYDDNFAELLTFAKQVAEEEIQSITLLIQHGMSIDENDPINPDHRKALGFWRCFSKELGDSNCFCIDADELEKAHPVISLITQNALQESQIILRDQAYVPRLVRLDTALAAQEKLPAPTQDVYLNCSAGVGTLHWSQRSPVELEEDAIRIRIEATALNFRDVMSAIGLYPGDAGDLGYECSGVVLEVGANVDALQPEDRVIVMGEGLFGRETVVNQSQVVKMPDTLSFAEGASIPIVFVTANEALNSLAKLKKGQKILIHAATGGVGLAAIQFAKLKGAEVFATTSAPKQDFLKKQGVKHVYDSRSTDFGKQILKDTDGKGVDVVLNSLTSEGFIASSLSCLGQGGTFVEIGKLNIYTPQEMKTARPDVHYHVIELDTRLKEEQDTVQAELAEICKLFEQKKLQPLPLSIHAVTEAMEAFHHLEQAKHIGKVVLTTPPPFTYSEEGTYLITGGTGGLGISLAKHLIASGAQHIALTSRSAANDELKAWIEEQDVHLSHYQADVADKKALSKVITNIQASSAPLKGVFHTAGVLKDGLLRNLSPDDFECVMAPKVLGSDNLNALTKDIDLDCFVLFSSIASLIGSPGQSNYGAANAYMDGLAIQRKQHDLPALSINWGPFAKVGMAAGLESQHRTQGIIPLDVNEAFGELDQLLSQNSPNCAVVDVHWDKPSYQQNPYLSQLAGAIEETRGEWASLLASAPLEKREEILIDRLKGLLAEALGISDPHTIDANTGFFELGMDSLIALDLKNKLEIKISKGKPIRNTIFFDYSTINKLTTHILEEELEGSPKEPTQLDEEFLSSFEDELNEE